MPPYTLPRPRSLKLDPRQKFQPNFELLASHVGWRSTWSHIVAGQFSSAPHAGLFFYNQATGDAELYSTDGHGQITLLASLPLWRANWTHVVAGKFSDSLFTGLLCYDQAAGIAAMYEVDENANLTPLQQYSGWRTSWDQVTTVRIRGSAYTGIVLYDRAAGRGEIHRCTGDGKLHLNQASDGWRTTWSHVVGGYASGSSLLFYEAATGHCEIYQLTFDPSSTDPETNNPNNLGPVFQADVPPATAIVPGSFGWDDTYLFYDRATGTGNFVFLVYGEIHVVETRTWPTPWDIITSGGFLVVDDIDLNFPEGGFSDLLSYNRARGVGEFYLHEPPDSTPQQALAGYTSAGSVRAGQALSFFVSSHVGPYTIKIYRQSGNEIFMAEMTGLPSAPTPLPIRRAAWRDGAGWPVAGTLEIPADWPSGLYLARVEAAGGTALDIPFIIRSPEDGSQSKIVIAMNDTTYNAYNHWGGRSHYGFGSVGILYFTAPGAGAGTMPWGYRLSMRRPQASVFAEYSAKWTYWEVPLARWLARQGIEVEWCTLVDIHTDPSLLHRYAMLVNVGHAEYVSDEIREHVVRFVDAGGNAAFFGGNDTWWRIRIENGTDVSACYKMASLDPVADPNQQTVNWPAALSAEMQGVSWSGNAFAGDSHDRKDADGLLQYSVVDAGHWVFADTSLAQGDRFGIYGDGQQTIVGSETDVRTAQSPAGLETAAFVRFRDSGSGAVSEVATMVVFTRGGTVFNASTNDWTLGLSQDSSWGPIDQITRNVFDRFSPNWSHKDLSLVTGTPGATGNPAAYELTAEPTKHVVYRGDNGHIYELWWGAAVGWSPGDLTDATGSPPAAGDPAGYQFVGDSTQHVIYRGTDQHIHELWWDTAQGWGHGDLTAVVGTAPATGNPSGYAFETQATQHVLYRGVDHHIYELWWDSASGWSGGSLTSETAAPLAAGDPIGYVFAVDGTQHVIYRGIDGHIHELWWDATNGWSHGDLTATTGAPLPLGDPSGYSFEAQRTQHVVYRGTDNHVYELWWDEPSGWNAGDLTAETGSVPAEGDPAGYMFNGEGTQHVLYRDAVGHIHELWWSAASGWSTGDLTAVSGGPRAAGDPAGFAYDPRSSQHVFYRSADGHVHELRWG